MNPPLLNLEALPTPPPFLSAADYEVYRGYPKCKQPIGYSRLKPFTFTLEITDHAGATSVQSEVRYLASQVDAAMLCAFINARRTLLEIATNKSRRCTVEEVAR